MRIRRKIRRNARRVKPWTPAALSNAYTFLRGDMGFDATSVGTWQCQVSSKTYTQPGAASIKPTQTTSSILNNRGVLRFDGNDFLTSTGAASMWNLCHNSNVHMFMAVSSGVAKPSGDGAFKCIMSTNNFTGSGFRIGEIPSGPTLRCDVYNGASLVLASGAGATIANVFAAQNAARWVEWMYVEGRSGNEYALDASGGFTATTGSSTATPDVAGNATNTLYIGSRNGNTGLNYWTGDIGAILICSGEITGGELTSTRNWFNDFYGLTT